LVTECYPHTVAAILWTPTFENTFQGILTFNVRIFPFGGPNLLSGMTEDVKYKKGP